jgi:hypothetical protein
LLDFRFAVKADLWGIVARSGSVMVRWKLPRLVIGR